MLKVLIVTWYGLKEPLCFAAKELENLGYEVAEFPLFRFHHDDNDKSPDYLLMLHQAIQDHQAQVVLWWCTSATAEEMALIKEKNPGVVHVMFNWDDPYMWRVKEAELEEKASKVFDIALTCCEGCVDRYHAAGVKQSRFLLPGFDTEVHGPHRADESQKCDVAFLCTNLYASEHAFPDQLIRRKEIVDALEAAEDIDFKLYGPPFLQDLYPRSYVGEKAYRDAATVFASARINLCTHVVGDQHKYANERTVLIAGSGGGVLLVDPVKGMDEIIPPDARFTTDPAAGAEGVVAQVRAILAKPDEERCAVANRAHNHALQTYTWRHWALGVHEELAQLFFDPEAYSELNAVGTPSTPSAPQEA